MIQGTDLPLLNAALNSASAILLVSAYRAVRQRRWKLHRNLMLAAITTSAAFLTSYLIYHLVFHLHTPYQGPFRPLYLGILASHALLAIAVPPLVFLSVARALRAQKSDPAFSSLEPGAHFARHRAIARWTFPLWLYVSVTGVMIYLMLYQLPKFL